MTQEEQANLSNTLWKKYFALMDAKSALNNLHPDERPDYEAARQNIQTEMDFVSAVITNISKPIPIAFPSDDDIRRLQEAVGELEHATRVTQSAAALVTVAGRVISTWPVSRAG
jgi:hypothetical protein